MRLEDLVNKKTPSSSLSLDESIVLFENNLEQLEEARTKAWDQEAIRKIASYDEKLNVKNPYTDLIKKYGANHPWRTRDFGQEVKGFPNASQLLSLTGDFKRLVETLEKYKNDFDEKSNQFKNEIKELKAKSKTITDTDSSAGKSFLNSLKAKLEARKNELKKHKTIADKYAPQVVKAEEKMNKFEAGVKETERKKEVATNVSKTKETKATKRQEATTKFKQDVKDKMAGLANKGTSFGNEWKSKVKSLASKGKKEEA